jgi:Co/Zn/Cd efflux system component
MSVHITVRHDADSPSVLAESRRGLGEQFGIEHATIQLEREPLVQIE